MTVKLARTPRVVKLELEDAPPWSKFIGMELRHAEHLPSGEWLVRFGRAREDILDRFRVTGTDRINGSRSFQFGSQDAIAKLPEIFGMTEASIAGAGDDFIDVLVPAERNSLRPRIYKNAKAKQQALAPIKETIKAMAKESPPPDFTPAIPLREAIDTINTYKMVEGEAIELTISRRGRLKVKYEYGG